MKTPQTLATAFLAFVLSGGIHLASAETMPNDHAMMHQTMTMQLAENQMGHEGHGVLKAINVKNNKVQISHEAIATLQWPPMTMWFALRVPLPKQIKVGDKVNFELIQTDGKAWVISKIEAK